MEVKHRLNKIIEACIEESAKREDYAGANLINDLGLDSVSLVQLMVEVEETFQVEIDIEENGIEIITEYDRLLAYIRMKSPLGG